MRLDKIRDIVQASLNDTGTLVTDTEVDMAINEGHRLVCLSTFCYEKYQPLSGWGAAPSAYQNSFAVPTDCIAPLYVTDEGAQSRINPIKFRDFDLISTDWWNDVGSTYLYYCLFDPLYTAPAYAITDFHLKVYPKVNTTDKRVNMLYAACPPTLSLDADETKIPVGFEDSLVNYATVYGLLKRKHESFLQEAIVQIEKFFKKIGELNTAMQQRYPNGRDVAPKSVELAFNLVKEVEK